MLNELTNPEGSQVGVSGDVYWPGVNGNGAIAGGNCVTADDPITAVAVVVGTELCGMPSI